MSAFWSKDIFLGLHPLCVWKSEMGSILDDDAYVQVYQLSELHFYFILACHVCIVLIVLL